MDSENYIVMLRAATLLMNSDEMAARRWLASPKDIFEGKSPAAHGETAAGLQDVLRLIGRLEHGVFS